MKPTSAFRETGTDLEFGGWSSAKRGWASAAILAGLIVVILGPVTNPIATEELTGPIGKFMAPLHQALYLGHGYRFFAPDPGPSHLLMYKLHHPDGTVTDHQFPDPNVHWPRLLYHRWFMLSETIFEEHASQPDRESFNRMQNDLSASIERFQNAGKLPIARALQASRDRQQQIYRRSDERIRELVKAVASVLMARSDATKIELHCRERVIPLPADVVLGRKLDDPAGLSTPRKIGEFSVADFDVSKQEKDQP